MIIYNVTICVDKEVEHEWVEWMRSKHIIEVITKLRKNFKS